MAIGPPPVVTIIEPKKDQVEPASAFQSGSDVGFLCECNGVASPPASGLYSNGVALINHEDPFPSAPSDDDYFSADIKLTIDGSNGWKWNYDEQLDVKAEDPAPTANNNKLYVGAIWVDPMSMTEQIEKGSVEFKGKRVASCTTTAAAPAPAAAAPPPGMINSQFTPCRVSPSKHEDHWLQFQHLAVNRFGAGNILMRNGSPLAARRLAVSACDVLWQYGRRNNLVSRPLGEIRPAGTGWFFRGAPEASIVLWQGTRQHVIASTSRECPDLVDVDPRLPICVQVNFARVHQFRRNGNFSLWIKVLD